MKINLWEFLDMMGDIEVEIVERLNNGHDKTICIGYPDEIMEHLKLTYSTTRYKVFYINQMRHGILVLNVIED